MSERRLFVVRFQGCAIVSAGSAAEAKDAAEAEMLWNPGDIISTVGVGEFRQGDSFPPGWSPQSTPYGDDDPPPIEVFFSGAPVHTPFAGLPSLPKGAC